MGEVESVFTVIENGVFVFLPIVNCDSLGFVRASR